MTNREKEAREKVTAHAPRGLSQDGGGEICPVCGGEGFTEVAGDLLARSPAEQKAYDAHRRSLGKVLCSFCAPTGEAGKTPEAAESERSDASPSTPDSKENRDDH